MKKWVKELLPESIWRHLGTIRERWFDAYSRKSYSQEGEDMLLDRFLEHQNFGFFVDVGAHHPKRFSNTYRLYCKGWRGLNIDANPGSMAEFRHVRPRDINIEAAVSFMPRVLTYYSFNDPALNTFDKNRALNSRGGIYSIIAEINIPTVPLWKLLDQYVPPNTKIDLLTIDVEGLDYDVLRSNDWDRYSPELVLVECIAGTTWGEANSDPVAQLLFSLHYLIVAKTKNTLLFRLEPPTSNSSLT